jgi:lysophospholipase L1-like esterase
VLPLAAAGPAHAEPTSAHVASAPAAHAPSARAVTARAVAAGPALPLGSQYVALGDSYAAGYGLRHPTKRPVPACGQSADDYPHRLAARFGLALTDVSCAGATTKNVVSRSQSGAPPQVEALTTDTRLVTLSIGGNDADLFGTASSCLALSARGPVFSGRNADDCRSTLVRDGVDTLARSIDGPVATGIARALTSIRAHAPNAEVVVVGYPAIFPDAANTPRRGCFRSALDAGSLVGAFPRDAFPFTTTDTAYLNGVQARLDAVTRNAAEAAGATYVSTFAATESRSACSTKRAYVAGVTLSSTSGLEEVDLEPGALHPTSAGVGYMARRAAAAVVAVSGG